MSTWDSVQELVRWPLYTHTGSTFNMPLSMILTMMTLMRISRCNFLSCFGAIETGLDRKHSKRGDKLPHGAFYTHQKHQN